MSLRRSLAVASFVGASVLVVPQLPAGAAPATAAFAFTGEAQSFVVPAEVCSLTIDAFGAEGGDFGGEIVAGLGGRATATVPVTPGETLAVYVGGTAEDQTGGFNGGGDGGTGTENQSSGAGGGGGSDVRQGGSALTDRIVVAGGGGGRSNGSGNGGDGGGESGLPGTGDAPGGGGTQVGGGSSVGTGEMGTLGQGGAGGDGPFIAGGGGGAGYYGGGGASGAPAENADFSGAGGGGSGFGPVGTTFETGVRSGDGAVVLTFDAAAGTCPETPSTPTPTVAATTQPAVAPRFTG